MNIANRITIARIALIPLLVLFLQPFPEAMANEHGVISFIDRYGIYLAAIVFIIAAATDKVDGYIARTYNQVTNAGKLLDPLADKLLILTALIMLVQTGSVQAWAAVIIIGRESLITAVRVMAASKGIILAADRYGKWKLVLQVAAIAAVLVQNFPIFESVKFPFGSLLIIAAVLITVYSGFHYIRTNYKQLQFS